MCTAVTLGTCIVSVILEVSTFVAYKQMSKHLKLQMRHDFNLLGEKDRCMFKAVICLVLLTEQNKRL